jgi:hypothetical protein
MPDGSIRCIESGLPETFVPEGQVPTNGVPQQGNGGCPTEPTCGTRFTTIQGRCGPMRVKQRWDKGKGRWVRARRPNVMNPKANRSAMNRLKGAHREAKKIIDTLDQFAKPKRRSSRRKAVCCK